MQIKGGGRGNSPGDGLQTPTWGESVPNIEYFHKNKNLENNCKTKDTKAMFCLPDI